MTFANFFTKKNEKDILGSGWGLGECFSESFRENFFREGSSSFWENFFREDFQGAFFSERVQGVSGRFFREIFSGSFREFQRTPYYLSVLSLITLSILSASLISLWFLSEIKGATSYFVGRVSPSSSALGSRLLRQSVRQQPWYIFRWAPTPALLAQSPYSQ